MLLVREAAPVMLALGSAAFAFFLVLAVVVAVVVLCELIGGMDE